MAAEHINMSGGMRARVAFGQTAGVAGRRRPHSWRRPSSTSTPCRAAGQLSADRIGVLKMYFDHIHYKMKVQFSSVQSDGRVERRTGAGGARTQNSSAASDSTAGSGRRAKVIAKTEKRASVEEDEDEELEDEGDQE